MGPRYAAEWDIVMHLADKNSTAVFLEVREGDAVRSHTEIFPEDVKHIVALAREVIARDDNEELGGIELRRDGTILHFKKDEGIITYWFDRVGAAGDPPSDISVKDFRLLLAELENAADDMREHLSCL